MVAVATEPIQFPKAVESARAVAEQRLSSSQAGIPETEVQADGVGGQGQQGHHNLPAKGPWQDLYFNHISSACAFPSGDQCGTQLLFSEAPQCLML